MEKRRRTLTDRYRRFWRIIRFLSRRGTLLSKKPPVKSQEITIHSSRKKRQWRQWRKIRYLMRHGSLFHKRGNRSLPAMKPALTATGKKERSFSFYRSYRILRYLVNTNRLFSSGKAKSAHKGKRRGNRTYRRMRYLLRRGTLFKFEAPVTAAETSSYLRTQFGPTYFRIMVNSLLLFLLAYCIVFVLSSLATSLAALSYNIHSVIYYFKTDYLINAKEWKVDAIKVVYSTGPSFSLVFSLLTLVFFVNISQETWYIRLLLFWIFVLSFVRFFGDMLVGVVMTKGIGLSIAYLYVTEYKKLLIIILCSSILVTTGLLMTKLALFTGNTYLNIIDRKNRSYFLQSQFLLPSILGTGMVFLLKSPRLPEFDILSFLTLFILILPLIFRGIGMKDLYFDPDRKNIAIRLWALVATITVTILFRVVFETGLRIG